jgi:hypothetical protein
MDCRNAFQLKLNLDNCMTNKAPKKLLFKTFMEDRLSHSNKWLISLNQMKNNSCELFSCMGYGYIVRFALGTLLLQVLPESLIPMADILCSVK